MSAALYLADTNVISEYLKHNPDPKVEARMDIATRDVNDFRHSTRLDPWTGTEYAPGQFRP